MHEFIKYSIKLEDEVLPFEQDNPENLPTDDPNERELRRRKKSDWQAILADYQYGTHFFVYSKFIGNLNEDRTSFNLKSVQLFLQNYTGAVTVGLAGKPKISRVTPQSEEVAASRYENPRKFKLFIPVQALNVNDVGSVTDLNGEEGIEIRPGDLLETVTIFKPIKKPIGENGVNPNFIQNQLFVDELFETRMGEDVVKTATGLSRRELSKDFDEFDDSTMSTFEESSSAFDLVGATGSGILVPCRPMNSVFHI